MTHAEVLIVGGGLGGAAAAEAYRKAGGSGAVTILSADRDYPVHRPPLSKEYLRGDENLANVFVHPADFYVENDIELRLDTRVTALDLVHRRVMLRDGQSAGYETLVLATGARPRRLSVPGADLPGVFYLRSLQSSEGLREAAAHASRAVIVGAGFIGMEVAATLAQRGLACTVVEMAPRMWSRIVPTAVSAWIERYYRDHGVDLRFGVGIRAITGSGHVERVVLESGEELEADLVVAGVGAELNTQLAADAGLVTDSGIVVNEYLRTSDPHVYAIGDIAAFPDPRAGRIHTEHWDNALHQGQTVGKTLAGEPTPFDHVAYFFSDMFDLSLNMVGYPMGWDDVVVREDKAGTGFTAVYLKEDRVRAALMLNDDTFFNEWTTLIQTQESIADNKEGLADPDCNPIRIRVQPVG